MLLVFALPAAADLTGATQLAVTGNLVTLNLETGVTNSSGGDILWNGNTIAPQGAAKLRNLGGTSPADFAQPDAYYVQQAASATSTPIPLSQLVMGDVFVVVTNGGHTAKVQVFGTDSSFTIIFLYYTTFGVSAGTTAPPSNITQILNNSSPVRVGSQYYGVAPSSLFIVTGSSLSDAGTPVLQSSAAPGLPLTLNGTSLSVVVNGVTTHPPLYYTSPKQVAAVLPAATPVGTGTLTLNYRGAINTAPITVVPSNLGINTYNGTLGVVTDATTGALLTYDKSGAPGQIITLWATGLGADAADSDTTLASSPHSVNTPLQIYIGGVQATILYQGSAGYPGVNQINLIIPPSAPTGCWVSVEAISAGIVGNGVTLPINKGGGACLNTQSGLDGKTIVALESQPARSGFFVLLQTNYPGAAGSRTVTNSTNGGFSKSSALTVVNTAALPGQCLVNPTTGNNGPVITGVVLDAGTITLALPAGLAVTLAPQSPTPLPAGAIPVSGGAFTYKGSGGADVGPFSATISLQPLVAFSNASALATVDRSQPLRVGWTGGNPGSLVYIMGGATDPVTHVSGDYTCTALAEDGAFTIPTLVLLAVPAGPGSVGIENAPSLSFSAPGVDTATLAAGIYYNLNAQYQ